jgi:hypothetical protein
MIRSKARLLGVLGVSGFSAPFERRPDQPSANEAFDTENTEITEKRKAKPSIKVPV